MKICLIWLAMLGVACADSLTTVEMSTSIIRINPVPTPTPIVVTTGSSIPVRHTILLSDYAAAAANITLTSDYAAAAANITLTSDYAAAAANITLTSESLPSITRWLEIQDLLNAHAYTGNWYGAALDALRTRFEIEGCSDAVMADAQNIRNKFK